MFGHNAVRSEQFHSDVTETSDCSTEKLSFEKPPAVIDQTRFTRRASL
ncbi:MAG: hypothetical protein JWQ64_2338 [Subtercola sp.]|nr:hypothetical protein [Subtercola sp.]